MRDLKETKYEVINSDWSIDWRISFNSTGDSSTPVARDHHPGAIHVSHVHEVCGECLNLKLLLFKYHTEVGAYLEALKLRYFQ